MSEEGLWDLADEVAMEVLKLAELHDVEKIFQEEGLLGQSFVKERNDMTRKLQLLTHDLKWGGAGGEEGERR